MKAFDEWWEQYTDETGYSAVGVGHDAWKAALEWVLNNGTLLDTHYACGKSNRQIIEDELEDES